MRFADVLGAVKEAQNVTGPPSPSSGVGGGGQEAASPTSLNAQGTLMAQRLAQKRAERVEAERKRVEELKKSEQISWKSLSPEFKSACAYAFFLCVFCAACFAPRNASSYYLHKELQATFFEQDYSYGKNFYTIDSWAEAEQWIQTMFLPNWLPTQFNSSGVISYVPPSLLVDPLSVGSAVVSDLTNSRVGLARLRVLRVNNDTCTVPQAFGGVLTNCLGALSHDTMAKGPHSGVNFSDDLDMPSFTSFETGITYPGVGYTLDLQGNYQNASASAEDFTSNFLDDNARAILLDFSVYNVHADLFGVATAVIEFLASGSVFSSAKLRISPLLVPHRVFAGEADSFDTAFLILELILYGLVWLYILGEIREVRSAATWAEYIFDAWNIVDIVNYSLFVATFIIRMIVIATMENLAPELDDTEQFLNLVSIAELAVYADSVNAFNAVLVFIKIFKYTHTNKKLAQFTDTLAVAYGDMVVLTLIILLLCGGYGLAFTLCFGSFFAEYRNVTESLVSLFQSVMGSFDMDGLREVRPIAGLILFLSFIYLMFFIVVSMFLATVDRAYEAVRTALLDHKGHLDPLNTDLRRLGEKAMKVWRYIDEIMSDDAHAREKMAQQRKDAAKAAHAKEQEERRQASLAAYKSRVDPMRPKLGDELFETVRKQIYSLELGQAELGKVLSKLDVRIGALVNMTMKESETK